jgi:CubicO group peptidase (beta-lactamase class C family)
VIRSVAVCSFALLAAALAPVHVAGRAGEKDDKLSVKEMTAILEKARAKYDVPGMAAGIVRLGEKPLTAIAGVRKRGVAAKVTIDDAWHLGSNTKPMTALLTAVLIDQGLLDWETPLEQIFPEYASKWKEDMKKITPAHLVTHTSGLPDRGPVRQFMAAQSVKTPQQDRAKIVKDLAEAELSAKPGEKYEYSNLGYILLGAIIDKRGKAPWEEQFKKRICQPLGIKHWALGTLYPGPVPAQPYPHEADGKPIPTTGVIDNPAVMNPSARVRLSIGDYCIVLSEILKLARGEKGFVKPATAQKMFTTPFAASAQTLSGWGSNRKPPGKGLMLGHEGSNVLNYCTVLFAVDDNLVVCVLANQGAPGGGPGQRACIEVREELGRRARRMQ